VLLSSGLEADGRRFLLDSLEPARYAGLAALLRERPEILARAAAIRRAAQ
jgi:hypothetical protein